MKYPCVYVLTDTVDDVGLKLKIPPSIWTKIILIHAGWEYANDTSYSPISLARTLLVKKRLPVIVIMRHYKPTYTTRTEQKQIKSSLLRDVSPGIPFRVIIIGGIDDYVNDKTVSALYRHVNALTK
jgi:hypothetical protein